MAFTTGSYWEVEPTGLDTQGGGFDTGVAGFPTDGAATVANTASPVFTSASYNFVAGDVGAWIFVKSGTNWIPGWYKIASVAANAATLSAASGAGVLFNGFGATTTAGCATVASPTTATWGIDYSQQASAQISFTDMVIDGTTNTKFTSAGNPVGKNFIGNVISVNSGSGFTVQRVAIVSTSGTTATCDKSLGTLSSTAGNGKLGGAILSPAIACSVAAISNFVFIKAGTYSITSNSTNIAGGTLLPANNPIWFIGYNTNRYFGNTDTQPVIQNNGSTITPVAGSGTFVNITFDGNTQTSARLSTATRPNFIYCTLKNYNTISNGVGGGVWLGCLFTGNSVCVISAGQAIAYCEAYGNTATPFNAVGFVLTKCLAYSNTGASTDGFTPTNDTAIVDSCIAIANGRDGFRTGTQPMTLLNCHAEGNTGFGYTCTGRGMSRINCSAYNNTAGATSDAAVVPTVNQITPTGSVFISTANNNYSLNNLPNRGALLRQAGYFGYLKGLTPRGTTVALPDIGAVQSRVPWQTVNFDGGIDG